MKRLVLTAFVSIVCVMVFAQKVTIDKITYKIEKGEACVYEADRDIEVANILASVEYKGKSYPVTKIGYWNKRTLVHTRSQSAFMECEKLASVIIPNSVVTICSFAFAKCHSLKNVTIPNSVTSIGYAAFWDSNITEISIPNSVKSIESLAFRDCPLIKLIVPDEPIFIQKYSGYAGLDASGSVFSGMITEVRCQNGSFPLWILPYLPKDCPFMLAQKYQQGGNNNVVYVQNIQQQPTPSSPQQEKKPSSDVDVNLPSNATNNENTFAVIIANENYQEEAKVEYALNDGEMFKEYCNKVLGLPEDNIHLRTDATLNNIKAELTWMQKVANAYNGQGRFIVYYAGHGIPDEKTGTAYLLPVDGKGTMLETGYSLAQFYQQLSEMPTQNVTVFMDACFSGSKRGDGMLASARGVALKAKAQTPKGKMVVFTAAQGDETAYPFKEKEHGLFTYYLLKKLKETKGNVTYDALSRYICEQVSRKSIVANSKSQTPTVTASPNMQNIWKNLKLK